MKLGIRLGLLALVAVVLGGVYVFLSRDTEPTTTGFLYTFPSGDRLEEMRIVNQKGSVLLARKDGKWDITEPGAYRANQQKAGLMEESPAGAADQAPTGRRGAGIRVRRSASHD